MIMKMIYLSQMQIPVVFNILISMKIGQVYNCKDHWKIRS